VNTDEIWRPLDLKTAWRESASEKAMSYFENFVVASNAQDFKTPAEHAKDTNIPVKYIKRALFYFHELELANLEIRNNQYRITFKLPITCFHQK
jgi:hypothetical protein